MNPCAETILEVLADGRARTSDEIARDGHRAVRSVRYWLSELARDGRVTYAEYAGERCPACHRPLSRSLRLWMARPTPGGERG